MDINESQKVRHLAIVGIAKDVASSIDADYQRIQNAFSSTCDQISWFIVESNSTDNSPAKLTEMQEELGNFRFKSLGRMPENNSRFVNMAKSRNVYLHEIRNNPIYETVDFVAIVDLNELNNKLEIESVRSSFKRDDWDVCTANQNGPYYDIWALRHPLWSPNDCWREHEFLREHKLSPEKALLAAVHSRMLHIARDSEWIEVESAFGGLAIYKRWTLDEGSYNATTPTGQSVCEHVSLHASITGRGGKIFVNPSMINTDYTDHTEHTRILKKIIRISKYPIKYLKSLEH